MRYTPTAQAVNSRYAERVWSGLVRVARVVELGEGEAAPFRAALEPLPEETKGFASARLESFVLGRAAALSALRALGMETTRALAIEARGAPAWPRGIVGSITHDLGRAACAVARDRELRGVGIDLQRATLEDAATVALVATSAELDVLAGRHDDSRFSVIFSAKETLYKCLAETVGAFFGFEDARAIAAGDESVRLRLQRTLAPSLPEGTTFDVRYGVRDGVVRTALEWPA